MLVALLLSGAQAVGWPRYVGDLDGDGRATAVDLRRLIEHLQGIKPLGAQWEAFADVNQDGKVDQADVLALNQAILGATSLPTLKDTDRDGLPDLIELATGLKPDTQDSDGNGVKDADEDMDGDGLANGREIASGTDPLVADTDGDGWNDEAEVSSGSDPLRAPSRPRLFYLAAPPAALSLPSGLADARPPSWVLAQPAVSIILPSSKSSMLGVLGMTMGRPPVQVTLPASIGAGGAQPGLVLAAPPLSLCLPASDDSGALGLGLTVGRPPVSVVLPGAGTAGNEAAGTVLAFPPISVEIRSQ